MATPCSVKTKDEYLGFFLIMAGLFLFQMEPDFSFRGLRWGHELPDGLKNTLKLSIIFFLHLLYFSPQLLMGS
jgi:hypothetical protein